MLPVWFRLTAMPTVQRYDVRIPRVMKVKVSGVDSSGHRFTQTASTVNISRSGARLDGVPAVNRSQPLEVSRGWFKKARFRVIWTGAPGTFEAAQVGVRCMEPDPAGFWGIDFPPPRPSTWKPASTSAPAGAIPETGPIPFERSSRDPVPSAPRATPTADYEQIVHPEDAMPSPWREEARQSEGDRRVPVTIRWSAQGQEFEESLVMARVLKDGSCMVSLRNAALEGTEVDLTHGYSGQRRTGRIAWCGPRAPDGGCPASIELLKPNPKFWDAPPSFGS